MEPPSGTVMLDDLAPATEPPLMLVPAVLDKASQLIGALPPDGQSLLSSKFELGLNF
jgi:hypothetical protein